MSGTSEKLLEIEHLKQYFPAGGGRFVKAVDDVSFFIKKGETLRLRQDDDRALNPPPDRADFGQNRL